MADTPGLGTFVDFLGILCDAFARNLAPVGTVSVLLRMRDSFGRVHAHDQVPKLLRNAHFSNERMIANCALSRAQGAGFG